MIWSFLALLIGFCVDLLIGDPHSIPHPVVGIGKLISALETALRRVFPKTCRGEIAAGAVLWILVVSICTAVPAGILFACHQISPWLRLAVESLMCWQILATKSLKDESMKVYAALETGDLEKGRYAVSMIVGRDTARLDDAGVTRAAVETVAENTSDGVVAPMFFLALGGAPLGFFYKAINTMDSMLGYVEPPYKNIGLVPAKMDDVANYIPARLSALLMGRLPDGIGCQKWMADFPKGPLSPRKPQLRANRVGLCRTAGGAVGRGCLVSRGAAQKAIHRR